MHSQSHLLLEMQQPETQDKELQPLPGVTNTNNLVSGPVSCQAACRDMQGHARSSEVVAVLPGSYWLCHPQSLCAHPAAHFWL